MAEEGAGIGVYAPVCTLAAMHRMGTRCSATSAFAVPSSPELALRVSEAGGGPAPTEGTPVPPCESPRGLVMVLWVLAVGFLPQSLLARFSSPQMREDTLWLSEQALLQSVFVVWDLIPWEVCLVLRDCSWGPSLENAPPPPFLSAHIAKYRMPGQV